MWIIYKHTCKITNKSYIGYTSETMEKRWKRHLKVSKKENYKISKALRKYPDQFWIHEVLIDNIPNIEEAKKLEILCIFYYDTFVNGYNSTLGGDGINNYHHTKETKRKLSKISKGNKNSLGRIVSEETKKKISNSLKGHVPWNKGKKCLKKYPNWGMKGKKHSLETREKQRQQKIKNPINYWKGKKRSKKDRIKMSKSHIGKIPWNKGKIKKDGIYVSN